MPADWTRASLTGRPQPPVIGLTGPIGCGKSTVARMLGELGGTVIDADELARRATDHGRETLPPIRQRFGDVVFQADGALDRGALAAIVFSDAAALADLEAIVHPAVRRMVNAELERAAATDAPFVTIEAIKLVEGGLADRCDEIWLVTCDAETQRQRLTARGMAPDDIDRRLSAQGSDFAERVTAGVSSSERLRTLVTGGTPDETRAAVEDALADLMGGLLGIP